MEQSTLSHFGAVSQVQRYTVIRRFRSSSGEVEERSDRIELRYTWQRELQRLITLHGLEVVEMFGDWEGASSQHTSRDIVSVARKP